MNKIKNTPKHMAESSFSRGICSHDNIDAVGDMFTSGGMICGALESYKGSHALNNIVLKKLFSDPKNYVIIDAE